jgi:hypothetical protein
VTGRGARRSRSRPKLEVLATRLVRAASRLG